MFVFGSPEARVEANNVALLPQRLSYVSKLTQFFVQLLQIGIWVLGQKPGKGHGRRSPVARATVHVDFLSQGCVLGNEIHRLFEIRHG